ncbi:MAG TPA: hypothetical protein DEG17_01470 [Cyanobacteria bacterium UBA11149]|nr:hypothetical protein [Cyanobacteria bacterium UBA11367]HBE56709.1 hypothetical protein [Cyanobacteria bacterium UBA11366]HBK63004.1 hypothetical protein [Cyanobacteria bacterium UBA11166]HBR76337.1 hypothetical protein [Cyanobacteria bacterium UBA11159]HBS70395.1 hypothetical protein [Cyanobacteria bacterium UBA11153]HBW87579.1 hypothetical protein [Cyanobacteria bacterium UBA11149]HCA97171.1 hypothetical protein [Cyanobacteria bacterium UBA9226]
MLKQINRYKQYILWKNSDRKDLLHPYIFWLSVLTMYLVVNSPKNRILLVVSHLVESWPNPDRYLPPLVMKKIAIDNWSDLIVEVAIIPIKSLLFYIAIGLLFLPIFRAIKIEKKSLLNKGTINRLIGSLLIFLTLSILVFPYRYPLGSGGMGIHYAIHSTEPFSQNAGWYYRRLLMMAIAHFLQMDGPILYYLFSLFCTYILIFMSLSFVESKIFSLSNFDRSSFVRPKSFMVNSWLRFICYLSLATSSFILFNFQTPGYTEQFFFILLLIAASIPMNRQERLSIFALSLATHEVSIFVFIPIIWLCFPRREIANCLAVIGLYFVIWLGGNGFNLVKAVSLQSEVEGESGLYYWLNNPVLGLGGLFLAYKLVLPIVLYLLWKLWQDGERKLLMAILALILVPAVTIIPSVDTSRMMGMGFFGVLVCFSILINEWYKLKINHNIVLAIAGVNIFVPSYNVFLYIGFQCYSGLYYLLRIIPERYTDFVR